MNDLITTETSLIDQLIEAIKQNKELRARIEQLENQLAISRRLQEKPKLYPPQSDPYFQNDEDGA